MTLLTWHCWLYPLQNLWRIQMASIPETLSCLSSDSRFDSRRCKLFENFFFRDVVLCRSLLLNIFWVVIEGELWLRCHDFTKSSFKCCKKSWHDRIVVSTLRCDRSNVTQVRILFEELRIFGRWQNFLIRLLCSIPERCKIKFRSNPIDIIL